MFARVLSSKVKPGMWDDYERYYNEKVVPPTQKMKGFRERRLLRTLESPDEGGHRPLPQGERGEAGEYRKIHRRYPLNGHDPARPGC